MPKNKRIKPEDYRKIVDALTNVKCCKCGRTIQVMSFAYATMHFDRKRYENKLCEKCKESEGTNVLAKTEG
jgi:C4-type Zn-finger protein